MYLCVCVCVWILFVPRYLSVFITYASYIRRQALAEVCVCVCLCESCVRDFCMFVHFVACVRDCPFVYASVFQNAYFAICVYTRMCIRMYTCVRAHMHVYVLL